MWTALFVIGCLLLATAAAADDDDRPVIRAHGGDLVLRPARGRSVVIRTTGPGSGLRVGRLDITKLLADTTRLHQTPSIDNSVLERVEALERYVRRNYSSSSTSNKATEDNNTLARIGNLELRVYLLTETFNRLKGQNQCLKRPCAHGGTCLRTVGGRQCICQDGWRGEDCEEDINECSRLSGTELGCQNGATCNNVPGGFRCVCPSGWFGSRCTRKEKDCSGNDADICGHGTCVSPVSGSGIRCLCDAGWTNEGASDQPCVRDVDECSARTPRCSVNPRVACVNLPGSFTCDACPAGFSGDGFACYDIDECETDNGGCSSTPRVSCLNTLGSRACGACPPGYVGDGVNCAARSSCALRHGGCHPSAACVQNRAIGAQYAQCICPRGMRGDGIGPDGCFVPSSAVNSSECDDSPCVNGRCRQLALGFTCDCERGYAGSLCDAPRDYCADRPCKNGGVCKIDNSTLGYSCECSALYAGTRCQKRARSCNAIYTTPTGNILYPSPNTSTSYNHNSRCFWLIRVPENKVINVTFTKFDLEPSYACQFDFLQINDGPTAGSQPIGRFCGDTAPKGGQFVSSHGALYLWFKSDSSVARDGFALHWESTDPVCGGEIDARTHGTVSSPGWPGRYPANRDCYWHLTAGGGQNIQLHFFALSLETHPNCSFDSLSIYEGSHVTDPLLVRYCNTSQPAPLTSSGAELLLHFHSDAVNNDAGFQISYAPVAATPGCGGQFTADRAEISSPTYDGSYLPNLICDYEIRVRKDKKIKLTVINFNLEKSLYCDYDYLNIYDGPSSSSKLLGRFCGSDIPHEFASSSNRLFLRFKTDSSLSREGFKFKYEIYCHNVIDSSEGIITSPDYPGLYPSEFTCDYVINTMPGTIITLTFSDFDIEEGYARECYFDRLEVKSSVHSNSSQIRTFCGNSLPPPVTTTHNYLYLKFYSDFSVSGRGFKANYSSESVLCGGVHTASNGTINYPVSETVSYENNVNCKWIILAPVGYIIMLTWNELNVGFVTRCHTEYVQVYEYINGTQTQHGRYCGRNPPMSITSATNELEIELIFYLVSRNDNRFSVFYQMLDESKVCGGAYSLERGHIRSPSLYNNDRRDCVWIIKAPPDHQIYVNVSTFTLQYTSLCRLEYLEIRNGPSSSSPLIGKYCADTIPRRFTTHANSLYLHFHTSRFFLGNAGFDLEWHRTVTGCGGTVTGSFGTISSPNYPQPYTENAECFWKIVVNSGSVIRINFLDLDLEQKHDCFADYVQLFDGNDNNSPILGKFCFPSSKTANIVTKSNKVFIKFKTDITVNGKGFLLNYYADCNTNITGMNGVIESLDFPNGLTQHDDCLWTIRVPKGNTINATFTDFYIKDHPILPHVAGALCKRTYVEIKDEINGDFRPRLCGDVIPNQITTRNNTLFIKLTYGRRYVSSGGFRLEWIVNGCGGHIKKEFGTITPPIHRRGEGATECEWLIETDPGKSISIQISDLNLIHSENCTIDAIELYNGNNAQSPMIARICERSNHTQQAGSTSNVLFFKYRSTSRLAGSNFRADFTSDIANCGGVLVLPSGTISSPNYPRNYNKNSICIWYITVSEGHRVKLQFHDLDLYYNRRNCEDSVEISDTLIEPENYIVKICDRLMKNATIVESRSNFMKIKFTSGNFAAKGFTADFSTICGSELKAMEDGYLNIGNTNFGTENNCTWTILANKLEQKISVTLTYIDIPITRNISSDRHCPSDFLRIFDGNDQEAPIAGEYCGRKVPKPFISHGSAVVLQLGSYGTKITGHFSARYSVLDTNCGGTLTSLQGTITSPGYPKSYEDDTECVWNIIPSPGNSLSIDFEFFKLENSDHCNEDYLEVREGGGGGKLLGVYCGDNIPPVISSSSSPFYVKFHSNMEGTGEGFLAYYTYETHVDIDHKRSGTISSPLYPKEYRGAGHYTWRIMADFSSYIAITITRLQIDVRGRNCYNYLAIFDGYDNTAPLITRLCGLRDSGNKDFRSTSNSVYIELFLDDSNERSSFAFDWMSVDKILLKKGKTNDKCTNVIVVPADQSVEIKSPNYPQDYENNLNCEWIYETSSDRHLQLMIKDFQLEQDSECVFDYVSVYSGVMGTNDWRPIIDRLCRQSHVRLISGTSNVMKIKFVSDNTNTNKGFLGEIISKCGGRLTNSSGILHIQRTDLIKNYYSETKYICNWTIIVRPGKNIAITFETFNVKSGDSCKNYVSLKNGAFQDSPPLGNVRYCPNNTQMEKPLETVSNKLYVAFTSIDNLAFNNLRLRYEETSVDCGSSSRLDSMSSWRIIHSPNYPDSPLPYSECIWTFSAPIDKTIRLDFVDRFDLYYNFPTTDCIDEYVEIRDGLTQSSTLLGKFCDENELKTVKSSGNSVYVRYFTDRLTPNNGFKMNVSLDTCGGTLRGPFGQITSPGYPVYPILPPNTLCEWRLIGISSKLLWINIEDVELPHDSIAKVVVEDVIPFNNSVVVNKIYQGSSGKDARRSKSDEVLVSFHYSRPPTRTVLSSPLRGFKLTFNSTDLACGGYLNSRSGYIETPEFSNLTRVTYCVWRIKVPDMSKRIRLEIINSGTPTHSLMIYHDLNYRALLRFVFSQRNNDTTNVFETSGNVMTVMLLAGSLKGIEHFRAHYSSDQPALCGGQLTDEEGTIKSPPINYNMSFYCQWSLSRNVTEESIQLNTYYLKINSTLKERYSYVSNTGIIIKETGSDIQNKIISRNGTKEYRIPAKVITIEAYKNLQSILNFNIKWSINPCGGNIHITDNAVDILNLPRFHNGSLDCAWYVKRKPGLHIKLEVEGSFSLSCSDEFIKLSSSASLDDGVAAIFCRDRPDNNLQVNYQTFYIHYSSNFFTNNTLRLKTVIQESKSCGGRFTDPSESVLRTPNYPRLYGENQECVWEISTSDGNIISLWFQYRFYIEDTVNCTKDYVVILDWKNGAYEETNKLCGRQRPERRFNSTGSKMKIIFRSDANINADGFEAKWEMKCGGTFIATEQEQYIYSPNYPHLYYPNMDCKYTILPMLPKKIYLNFLSFNIESGISKRKCGHDNVTISNDLYVFYYSPIDTYCGGILPPAKAYEDGVDIRFRTDSSVEYTGFQIIYKLYSCGGNITTHTTINSGEKIGYDNSVYCQWNITAPINKIVVIRFEKFQLEKSVDCSFDSVEIFNGFNVENDNRIAALCGDLNNSLPVFRSTGQNMVVTLTTDYAQTYNGFSAKIYFSYGESVGCGGNVIVGDNTTVIKSPMLPGAFIYEKYLDCHWMIQAPVDKVIKLEFKRFNVAPCDGVNQTAVGYSRCRCDVVRVYDGASTLSDVLATYCGHTVPPKVTSSGASMLLTFYSDGERESRGFEVSVSAVNTECGQRYYKLQKNTVTSMKSPRYGVGDTPRGLRCVYHVELAESYDDQEIHVHVNNIDLEPANANHRCNSDSVVISAYARHHNVSVGPDLIANGDSFYESGMPEYAKDFLQEKVKSTLCGKITSMDLHVYDSVTITLTTTPDEVVRAHEGFDIRVSTRPDCVSNISDTQGRLSRKIRSSSENCYILLTAPVNNTISLYFYHVLIYSDAELEIYDGPDQKSPLLTRLTDESSSDTAVFSNGRYLLLRDKNGDGISDYELNYITNDKGRGCGGTLNNVAGSLSSPLYPEPSREVRSCAWELTTPPQTELRLTFVHFDLGVRALCSQVYLELIDRAGTARQYCADDDPADYGTSDGYVKLVYHTTMNTAGPGWLLHFVAIPNSSND